MDDSVRFRLKVESENDSPDYNELHRLMKRPDSRPPLKIDKERINWNAYAGIMRYISSAELAARIETALKGAILGHYIIGVYALKVQLNDPELNAAWNRMMDDMAPRGVKLTKEVELYAERGALH